LGPGKGIEWAIDALGELSDLDCSPEYVIAGQTHPHVKSHQGEKYREELYRRVAENNLQDDVVFVDAYLDSEHLETLISSADVVVLPYDSLEQVTSGVLVEALVAGKPVIATNFPHAREALADGSGILVDQRDSHAIANGLRTILGNDSQAAMMHEKSSKKANQFLWSSVSGEYVDIANALAAKKLSKKLVS
jgi:glycosyltransferase involved in cell wall biosynthesis